MESDVGIAGMPDSNDTASAQAKDLKAKQAKAVQDLTGGFCYILNSLENIERKLDIDMFPFLEQPKEHASEIANQSILLANATEAIQGLENRLKKIEVEQVDLKYQLDEACAKIVAQEQTIQRFIDMFGSIDFQSENGHGPNFDTHKRHADGKKKAS